MSSRKAGQGLVEYLLMMALVVGIITGVLAPFFKKEITNLQNGIVQGSSQYLSQQTMGLPMNWFFAANDASFDSVGSALNAAAAKNNNLSNAGNNGNGNNPNANNSNNPNASGNNPNANNAVNNALNRGGAGRGSGNGSGSGRNSKGSMSADDDTDEAQNAGSNGARGGGRRGGGSYGNAGGNGDVDTNNRKNKNGLSVEGSNEDDKKDEASASNLAKARSLARPDDNKASGCSKIDFFTLLKVAAILAILIIAGVTALTSKGNKK